MDLKENREQLKDALTRLEVAYSKKMSDGDFTFWIDCIEHENISVWVFKKAIYDYIVNSEEDDPFMPKLPQLIAKCKKEIRQHKIKVKNEEYIKLHGETTRLAIPSICTPTGAAFRLQVKYLYGNLSEENFIKSMEEIEQKDKIDEILKIKDKIKQ